MLSIKDQNYFKRALKIFILSTALLLVTIPIALIFHPSEEFIKQLGSSSPESVSKTHGLKKVWGFIQNNAFHVPIQMLLLALIPIPFLYTINLIVSVIIPGILFGFLIHFDTYKGLTSLIAYIPHYTLEIMSFCIFTSGLYMLNKSIIRKITNLFRKEKKENHSFKTSLFNLLKAYLFICLPMVILAAFTETYVADMLSNLMN
ncbi:MULTISPECIES: stage II sporulation protein M [Staphylococcus]|uniref:stage II sporulation protein M n=1 Tax=Staphylococcus TaxID=1279 RepID=UPI000DFB2405|nr:MULTISPECIES: stage II sporulation protein M [Staphylococcus]MCH4390557.1 stage II sporulation protein M [Staphylococcus haemolyticus]MCH4404778.1 stage II sporulation protein M [Staphylococcus haemolyticus]MCH4519775.1 stage II sporulation protein M [Staphylococcus haemolyticus]SUM79028.1 membrane protein [Staphylococcus cohnii]